LGESWIVGAWYRPLCLSTYSRVSERIHKVTHFEFSFRQHSLKGFDAETHDEVFQCEAHGESVECPTLDPLFFGHYGLCPIGDYMLGTPRRNNPGDDEYIAEGSWFIPILDVHDLWVPDGRSGLGIHGGGTGLADPFLPEQGWALTLGCIRLQNADLQRLALLLVNEYAKLTVAL
jgi:hypothetical protein